MKHLDQSIGYSRWEIPFQIGLHILVFIFYAFERRQPFQEYHYFFFLNYAFAVLIINFVLLPNYFYQKKYWHFFLILCLMLCAVILMEELVLEKIYFPEGRGKRFPGIFYSLMDVLPVITILSGFKFAWDVIRKQQQVEELKVHMEESELRFLKSQINPHFLFNNLNNLYSYALANSPKTPEIILELSGVLRYMLYECKEKFVPLTNELKQLENFVRLNEMQIEERGQVKFEVIDESGGQLRIAPLLLMVFIENAFKHSTASQSVDILINIKVQIDLAGQLEFNCKNTYQDDGNNEDLSKGIGLENVNKRLAYIYPNAFELSIVEEENTYDVKLKLDLN